MNDDAMKKQDEPSPESLEEMPEIDDQRFRRLPGRGHHVNRSLGEIVAIEPELWAHFGSAEAVDGARLRSPDGARRDRPVGEIADVMRKRFGEYHPVR